MASEGVRYYLGPHLSQGVENVASLADALLRYVAPGSSDMESLRQSGEDTSRMAEALKRGSYGEAANQGALATAGALSALPLIPSFAGIFAGKGAKTADLEKLFRAQQMSDAGKPREDIWTETGWFQGPDEKWRFEIDDRGARLDMNKLPDAPSVFEVADAKLGEMPAYQDIPEKLRIGNPKINPEDQRWALNWAKDYAPAAEAVPLRQAFSHPQLEMAYPDIEYMKIRRADGMANGYYSGRDNMIATGGGTIGNDARSTALHEMQHNMQDREGFAQGGSPDMGWTRQEQYDAARKAYDAAAGDDALLSQLFDKEASQTARKAWDDLSERERLEWLDPGRQYLYRRLAGEAEARNVQARMEMTPDQRRANPPWTTLDVPEAELIARVLSEYGK